MIRKRTSKLIFLPSLKTFIDQYGFNGKIKKSLKITMKYHAKKCQMVFHVWIF